jgi:hypothetical protein
MKFDTAQHEKNIRLTRGFLQGSEEAAATALRDGKADLVFFNLRGVVTHQLELALYHWRVGDNPVSFLEGAVAAADRAIEVHEAHPDWPGLEEVNFVLVRYLTFLLDREDRFAPYVGLLDAPDALLDYGLVETLHDRRPAEQTYVVLQKVEEVKRLALLARTYRTYFEILGARGVALPAKVAEAERNYAERKRDGFYAGGAEYSGGGPANPHVVDFVLAAVLKKVDYEGPSIHRFRW